MSYYYDYGDDYGSYDDDYYYPRGRKDIKVTCLPVLRNLEQNVATVSCFSIFFCAALSTCAQVCIYLFNEFYANTCIF